MHSDEPVIRFREVCGATGPLALEVEDARTREMVRPAFDPPFLVIGCGGRADLVLDAPELSQRHAYLQVIGGRVFCFDLRSRSGIRREQGSGPSGWLGPGEAVGLGPFTVRLVSGVPDTAVTGPDPLGVVPAGHDSLPGLILEAIGPAAKTGLWRMNRVLAFIGHAPECRVRIQDGSVSRFSCSLVRTPAGAWIVDLRGRSGVLVNDMPVRWALLRNGDVVRVGSIAVRVRYEAPAGPYPVLAFEPGIRAVDTAALARTGSPPAGAGRLAPALPAPLPLPPGVLPPGLPADRPDVAAWLVPLTNQFGLMQQQMFDQFTQVLLMMGQMFSQLHREQLGLVREELERLQEVSLELRTLQAELVQSGRRPGNETGAPAAAPARIAPAGLPPASAGALTPNGTAAPAPQARSASEGNPMPTGPGKPPLAPGGGLTDQDIHAALCRRIQELQQERETRWQKLLNGLLGKRGGE
jgi:pSer/pThr/pTyr-binding forkhead associated (FHA) protein